MTKEQWEAFLGTPIYPGSQVILVADGHKITLQCGIHRNRVAWMAYVDGMFKGDYVNTDHEYRKYMCEKTRQYPSQKELKERMAGVGKRFVKQNPQFFTQKTIAYWSPVYGSLKTVKKRLMATCTSIEPFTNNNTDEEE